MTGGNAVSGRTTIQNAREFGKVALVYGGTSAEREVSLRSGNAVLAALRAQQVNVDAIDAGPDVLERLRQGGYDRVFIALHGKGGEDGTLQGALDLMGLPYTGSGVLGSSIGMDKLRTKLLWLGAGIPTPRFALLDAGFRTEDVVAQLGLPMIVKPSAQGSSIGMSKVERAEQLQPAFELAHRYDPVVFAESWIAGKEYTASLLWDQALPMIRLETPRQFYDYEAKYSSNDTRYICPCGLAANEESRIAAVALKAFQVLGCSGWGRVDIMCDAKGAPWLLEVNTVPGMTDHSLVPMAARAAGLSFEQLVWRILETSFERRG